MTVVDMSDRRLDPLINGMIEQYTRHLARLAGDFSAAAAFLLSDPLFESLGCSSKRFVQAAKQAYADQTPVAVTAVRQRSRELIEETDVALAVLVAGARRNQQLLNQQRLSGEALAEVAERVGGEVATLLDLGVVEIAATMVKAGKDDPDTVAGYLSELAAMALSHVRETWEPIYAELANASMPPPPLAFSGRGIYIETVKRFNQRRVIKSEGSAPEARGIRGLFGGGRRQSAQRTAEIQADAVVPVLQGVADVIKVAVDGWQRGAMERVQRKGLETSAGMCEAALAEQLIIFERTIGQLRALRGELENGLSVRHFYLTLLKQTSSCSRSA
jgi:hypothetical protein